MRLWQNVQDLPFATVADFLGVEKQMIFLNEKVPVTVEIFQGKLWQRLQTPVV